MKVKLKKLKTKFKGVEVPLEELTLVKYQECKIKKIKVLDNVVM
jgi:hypothetical protein